MANMDTEFVDSFNRENGEHDGSVTFDEACVHVQGLKLNGPLSKPLKSDRAVGDVTLETCLFATCLIPEAKSKASQM